MALDTSPRVCPDCDEPVAYTFTDTAGVGAWKLGDGFNTTPDTVHFVCFACGKAWKQRLAGPLTPDVIGDLAFFSCGVSGCGAPLVVESAPPEAGQTWLACGQGHRFVVVGTDDGGLTLADGVSSRTPEV